MYNCLAQYGVRQGILGNEPSTGHGMLSCSRHSISKFCDAGGFPPHNRAIVYRSIKNAYRPLCFEFHALG
jgi:hypothetical protein